MIVTFNLKFVHMTEYYNYNFSTDVVRGVCHKYQVWFRALDTLPVASHLIHSCGQAKIKT